jgi:hypothetical protein
MTFQFGKFAVGSKSVEIFPCCHNDIPPLSDCSCMAAVINYNYTE